LDTQKLPKPKDIIEHVVPAHETSLLAGASGAGKTTLLMEIIKQLQHNEPVFGHSITEDLQIGFIAADRTWEAYKKLGEVVGVDISKLTHIRALIDDDKIDCSTLERNPSVILYNLLNEMVEKGCQLVVIDPLAVLLGCDLNKYHVVAAKLIQLNRYCRLNGITVLGTHHATKARTESGFKRPQDRINGSGALLGFTSTQLFLAAADETGSEYTEWHIVSHHAKAKVIHLKRDESRGTFYQCFPLEDIAAKAMMEGTQKTIAQAYGLAGVPIPSV
jgi:RecA-family ATPase